MNKNAANEILIEIGFTLAALGCQHDAPARDHENQGSGSTPPMMFPEWIRCVVAKRESELARLRQELAEAEDAILDLAVDAKELADNDELPGFRMTDWIRWLDHPAVRRAVERGGG